MNWERHSEIKIYKYQHHLSFNEWTEIANVSLIGTMGMSEPDHI